MLDFLLLVIVLVIVWLLVTLVVKGVRRLFRGRSKKQE